MAIVYPNSVLKIDKIYPIIVALLPLLIQICTKFVMPICAIPHPIKTVHMKTPLVFVKNDNYRI